MIDVDKKSGESFNQENQGSGIGAIFDFFSPETRGDEIEEQNFTRRLKKRKKRQRRMWW